MTTSSLLAEDPTGPPMAPNMALEPHDPVIVPHGGDKGYHLEAPTEDPFFYELMRMFGVLIVFVTCLLTLSWMLKKVSQSKIDHVNASSNIKILEKRTLSHKAIIYLIEIYGKTVAVAESTSGITKLAEFPYDAEAEGDPSSDE